MPVNFTDNRTIYSVGFGAFCALILEGSGGTINYKQINNPLIFIMNAIVAYAYCTAFEIGVEKKK